MEVEKKRMIFFGALLGLAIAGSVILFFWGNLINRGTLSLRGETPFTVQVVGFTEQNCETFPCFIKTKSGYKDLVINKAGYQSVVTSSTIKLWRTVNLDLVFRMIPQITAVDSIPETDKHDGYSLEEDRKANMQKLIDKTKKGSAALAYFPKRINQPFIIGGKNSALIIDGNSRENRAYFVDFVKKTRGELSLEELSDVEDGLWSEDGRYLLFSRRNFDRLWLLDTKAKTASELSLSGELKHASWSHSGKLFFVAEQAYSSVSETEIKLLPEKSTYSITFGIYDPANNQYGSIGDFAEVKTMPEEFIVTAGGETVYFRIDEQNFRIILEKF